MENNAPRITSSDREAYLISIGQTHMVHHDAIYKKLLAQEQSKDLNIRGDKGDPVVPPAVTLPALSGAAIWRESSKRLGFMKPESCSENQPS